MKPICLSKQVKSLQLLRRKTPFERLDLAPWALIYGLAAALAASADASRWPVSPWAILPLAAVAHVFSTLFQVWSMRWKVLMTCTEVASIEQAELILVEPVPHSGSPALVPVLRDSAAAPGGAAATSTAALPVYYSDGIPAPAHGGAAADKSGASGVGASDGGAAAGPALPLSAWLGSSPVRIVFQSMTLHLARVLPFPSTAAPAAGTAPSSPAATHASAAGAASRPASDAAAVIAFVPLSCPDRAPLASYGAWRGWVTHAQVTAATAKWGANAVDMPPPTFGALLREQALAPFFVFQMFSVGLWMLDEYWYYSLFSLATLLGMEAMQAFQRLRQHGALRSMRPEPSHVHRLRQGRWVKVPARDLLPGDVISLVASAAAPAVAAAPAPPQPPRTGLAALLSVPLANAGGRPGGAAAGAAAAQTVVPADCVLVTGSAVVNEAMLTGESAPVLKDALPAEAAAGAGGSSSSNNRGSGSKPVRAKPAVAASRAGSAAAAEDEEEEAAAIAVPAPDLARERLNAFLDHGSRSHSRHIVFAGTTLLQTSATGDEEEEGSASSGAAAASAAQRGAAGADDDAPPPPPDGGALAVVVRTGYQTSQGDLMRTIAHASQKVSAGNWESFVFIAGLLVFAIAAAWYVLSQGWGSPRHNKYKLALHCIMILTSVVPPELPIELALAVNASLATLAGRGIFCTEPFRIVYGGMVDVCCFDKTGTLTSDEFKVTGLVLPLGLIADAVPSVAAKLAAAETAASSTAGGSAGRGLLADVGPIGDASAALAQAISAAEAEELSRRERAREEEERAAANGGAPRAPARSKYARGGLHGRPAAASTTAAAPDAASDAAAAGLASSATAVVARGRTRSRSGSRSASRSSSRGRSLGSHTPASAAGRASGGAGTAAQRAQLALVGADSPLLPFDATVVLAGCHSLMAVPQVTLPPLPRGVPAVARPGAAAVAPHGASGAVPAPAAAAQAATITVDIIGDPMEKAALQAAGWALPLAPAALAQAQAHAAAAAAARTAASAPGAAGAAGWSAAAGGGPSAAAAVGGVTRPLKEAGGSLIHAAPRWMLPQAAPSVAGGRLVKPSPAAATAAATAQPPGGIRILKRWPFSSDLKRMSTAVALVGDLKALARQSGAAGGDGDVGDVGRAGGRQHPQQQQRQAAPRHRYRILTKGAPEVIRACLAAGQADELLPRFDATLQALASTGARILALAWKPLALPAAPGAGHAGSSSSEAGELSAVRAALARMSRAEAEAGLLFAGFLVITSPLKTDTRRTIRELQASNHRVLMATGDAALTAIAVAQQVGIVHAPRHSASHGHGDSHGHSASHAGAHTGKALQDAAATTAAAAPAADGGAAGSRARVAIAARKGCVYILEAGPAAKALTATPASSVSASSAAASAGASAGAAGAASTGASRAAGHVHEDAWLGHLHWTVVDLQTTGGTGAAPRSADAAGSGSGVSAAGAAKGAAAGGSGEGASGDSDELSSRVAILRAIESVNGGMSASLARPARSAPAASAAAAADGEPASLADGAAVRIPLLLTAEAAAAALRSGAAEPALAVTGSASSSAASGASVGPSAWASDLFLPLPPGEDPRLRLGPFLCVTGPALAIVTHHMRRGDLPGLDGDDATAAAAAASSSSGSAPDAARAGSGSTGAAATGVPTAGVSMAGRLLRYLAEHAAVFARTSPDQKETVVVQINSLHRAPAGEAGAGASSGAGSTGSGGAARASAGSGSKRHTRQHYTLMCGDGTNDVGALKQAHVGVSILSNPALEKRYDLLRLAQAQKRAQAREALVQRLIDQRAKLGGGVMSREEAERWVPRQGELDDDDEELAALVKGGDAALPAAAASAAGAAAASGAASGAAPGASSSTAITPASAASSSVGGLAAALSGPGRPGSATAAATAALEAAVTPEEKKAAQRALAQARVQELTAELFGGGAAGGADGGLDAAAAMGMPLVSLGDASMASPFTSRLPSPAACVEILRQGRCTLVVTHQVYRILAVNCLILSYQLSVLHLHGVRNGDTQATIAGIVMTAFFMFVSYAKPMKRLAPVHPHTTVFHPHLLLSVLGQFLIHLATLAATIYLCRPYAGADAAATVAATAAAKSEAAAALAAGEEWALGMDDGTGSGGLLGMMLGIRPDGATHAGEVGGAGGEFAPAGGLGGGGLGGGGLGATPSPIAEAARAAAGVVLDAADAAMAALRARKLGGGGASPFDAVDAAAGLAGSVAGAGAAAAGLAMPGVSGAAAAAGMPERLPYFEDMKFAPNVINTAVFLLSTAQQMVTFVINYAGAPFMQSLTDNAKLWRGFQAIFCAVLFAATGASDALLQWLQLVELPTWTFKATLIALIVADAAACGALEIGLRRLFGMGRRL